MSAQAPATLDKCPSGIDGLDEITHGGLPRGRTVLVTGGPGCGKTLFGVQFLVCGARAYGEPGVMMTFEEPPDEVRTNVASLGYDLAALEARGLLFLDHVAIDAAELTEAGSYDLAGLFVRLDLAIGRIGARRVVLDSLESLFGSLQNEAVLRSEIRRLFAWLKERGVTAVVTAESDDGASGRTRHGLEEFVSDCVISLDHRVHDQISTRRLRVVKYRGSTHGTNEYPFLIDTHGLAVMPVTSAGLDHEASTERVSSGVAGLDAMLGGGYYRGSTVLVSGTSGAGKSSLAATFADAVCASGKKCVYFAFEESPQQVLRNMGSIGVDLGRWVDSGRLVFLAERPTTLGLEQHLARMHQVLRREKPDAVVVDPVSDLIAAGGQEDAHLMVVRLVDELKSCGITGLMTSLTPGGMDLERTEIAISSIVDTWLLVRAIESAGERNRILYVLKSRGMAHSNQVREFLITSRGIDLVEPYSGPEGVLTGAARVAQEAREHAQSIRRREEADSRRREVERRRRDLEAQIGRLRADFADFEAEVERGLGELEAAEERLAAERRMMAERRDGTGFTPGGRWRGDGVDGGGDGSGGDGASAFSTEPLVGEVRQ